MMKKKKEEEEIRSHGGQCVKELRIHVRTTTILYGGITFNSLYSFHMLSLCNFIIWVNKEGACITNNSKLPIIPYPILLQRCPVPFLIPCITLKSNYNILSRCF